MRLGIDSQKLPEFVKRGSLASLDLVKELGLAGLFFPTVLDMSPTLDKESFATSARKPMNWGSTSKVASARSIPIAVPRLRSSVRSAMATSFWALPA